MALFFLMENRRTLKSFLGGSRKHERRPLFEECKKMRFIDTNIFLRYLTQDDEIKVELIHVDAIAALLVVFGLLRFFAGVKAERARDALLIPVFSPPEEK